jgi:amidase
MSAPDARDPWWVPAPLQGPPYRRRAGLVLRPGGLAIVPEVEAALRDAAARLADAGWEVEELPDIPAIEEAAALQARLWIGESFAPWQELAARDGDPGAAAVVAGMKMVVGPVGPGDLSHALIRRAGILRDYQALLAHDPVLILPVSAELPFPDGLDMRDFARVWRAQLCQVGLALTGLPALSVSTGLAGRMPVGVQLLAGRFREDICLDAAAAIEQRGAPPSPIDPAG